MIYAVFLTLTIVDFASIDVAFVCLEWLISALIGNFHIF